MLVAALVALFYLPWVAFAACCMVVVLLAAMEWSRLASLAAWPRAVFVACCLAGSAASVPGVLPGEPGRALMLAAVAAWVVGGIVVLPRRRLPTGAIGGSLTGLLLLVPAAAAVFVLYLRSPMVLLGAMAVVWISDSAAYFAGRAFGRHKLAAAISPGKTWEGVAGAMLATIAFGAICGAFFYDLMPEVVRASAVPPAAAALLAVVIAGFGIVGDLIESLAKRIAGVKDSGRLLPGHGGILDRIDALLPALPVAALAYLT
jgi:phosphatidate cytidylyltransferase